METPTAKLNQMLRECLKRGQEAQRPPLKILLGPTQYAERLAEWEANTGHKMPEGMSLHWRMIPIRKMQVDGIALVTHP